MTSGQWVAICLAIFGTLLALTVSTMAIAGARLRRSDRRDAAALRPDVSIVRPLCGLERFSLETLVSTFWLSYPRYEVILCVASSGDPIVPVAEAVMAAHPHVRSRLLIGDDRISANPKLNNCVKGWEAATSDWIVLADSNVLMPADYLQRLLAAWRPDSGLVCSTPIGTRPGGFWAEVECAFLNSLQARWQYAAETVGRGFAQGKTMLWYKPMLADSGRLRALAVELAEDAAATKLVRAYGLHVHLVDRPFEQPLGLRSAREVWARQLRWARLRRLTFPHLFLPELLSSPLVPSAVLAASAGPAAAGLFVGLWYAAELALTRSAGWHLSWRLPVAFVVRDALIPALWIAAFATRRIVWRGTALNLHAERREPVVDGA